MRDRKAGLSNIAPIGFRTQTSKSMINIIIFMVAYAIVRSLCYVMLPLYDDAFITLRYAENLATGKGLTYNLGTQVLGTTTPLFALLLAPFRVIGIDLRLAARLVSLISELSLILSFRSVLKINNHRIAWWILVSLMLIDPYISRIVLGGMESELFLAITVWSLILVHRNRYSLGVALAAVSVWIRPEGALGVLVALGWIIYQKRTLPWRELIIVVLLLALPILALISYYGSAIPQSVTAKSSRIGIPLSLVFNLFLGWNTDPLQLLLTITTLSSLPFVLRRSSFLRLLGLWIGLYLASYLIVRPFVWSWYALPVFVYKCLVTSYGAGLLLQKWQDNRTLVKVGIAGALSISIAFWIGLYFVKGQSPVIKNVQIPIQRFCCSSVQPTDKIYAQDIGVIGYYSRATILDHCGLVWREYKNYSDWKHILKSLKPKWAMLVTGLQLRDYLADNELMRLYKPVVRFSERGDTDIFPDPKTTPTGWSHDYLMLQLVKPTSYEIP